MSSFTHWFYVLETIDGYRIETFAIGNRSKGNYFYEDKEDLDIAIQKFEADGYRNLTRNLT